MEPSTQKKLATLLSGGNVSSWRDIKTPSSTPPPPNRAMKGNLASIDTQPLSHASMQVSPSFSASSLSVANGFGPVTENLEDITAMRAEIRDLKETLACTSDDLEKTRKVAQRREAERWEAVETMTEMAANFLLVDKERRSLRAEVEEARAMAAAARDQEQAQRSLLLAAAAASSADYEGRDEDVDGSLSPSSFSACCHDLEALASEVEQKLKNRSMFLQGMAKFQAVPSLASSTAIQKTPAKASPLRSSLTPSARHQLSPISATIPPSGLDSAHLAFEVLQELRGVAREGLAATTTAEALSLPTLTLPRRLSSHRQHQHLLTKLLRLLSSILELDSANLLEAHSRSRLLEEDGMKMQDELDFLRPIANQEAPLLREANASLKAEIEDIKAQVKRLRSKVASEAKALIQQNTDLRGLLDRERSKLQETQASFLKATTEVECRSVSAAHELADLTVAKKEAVKKCHALARKVKELQKGLQNAESMTTVLSGRLETVEGALEGATADAEDALSQLQEALGEVARAKEEHRLMQAAHEAEFDQFQVASRQHLRVVMDAYKAELEAMRDQVVHLQGLQATQKASEREGGKGRKGDSPESKESQVDHLSDAKKIIELEVRFRQELALQQEQHGAELQQATEAVSASGRYLQQVKTMLVNASEQGSAATQRAEKLQMLLSEACKERDEAIQGLEESKQRLSKLESATALLARNQREVLGSSSSRSQELEALQSKYEALKKRYVDQAQAQLRLQSVLLATKEMQMQSSSMEIDEEEERDEEEEEEDEENGAVSEEFSFGHQPQEEEEDDEDDENEEERYDHENLEEEEEEEEDHEDATDGHRYLSSRSSDVTDYGMQYAEAAGADAALDDEGDEEEEGEVVEDDDEEDVVVEEEEDEEEEPLEEEALPAVAQDSHSLVGRRVPPSIIIWAAQYAGDEGLARPSSASPSSLRASGGAQRDFEAPSEVIARAQQHDGREGGGRPGSAMPSSLRSDSRAEVPSEVIARAQQHDGREGGGRPGSAMPSSLRSDSRAEGL